MSDQDMERRRARLDELTLRMLDGELGEEEEGELETLLEDDDARAEYVLLLEQEGALRGERRDVDVVERTVRALDELAAERRVEDGVLRAIERERSRGRGPRHPPVTRWLSGTYRWAAAAILALGLGLGASGAWVSSWRASVEEVQVLAQKSLEPGAPANIRVLVRHADTLAPFADTLVRLSLVAADGVEAWQTEATTDELGVAVAGAEIPAALVEGGYTLRVVANTPRRAPTVTRAIVVQREHRLFVGTDKPRYQPGQVVRVRALAMASRGLQPAAARDLVFRVQDARGNLVFESKVQTSAYGLAAADFELAEQVNEGRYVVSAAVGEVVSERAVTVERYVLPKLKVALDTDATAYRPGDTITGTVTAGYTFGEPVREGTVQVTAIDGASELEMTTVTAAAGGDGRFAFTLPLPPRFGALDQDGATRVVLEARVADRAGFESRARLERRVSPHSLLAEVLVPGGKTVVGVPNRVFVATRTPDGEPVAARGELAGVAFETDASGLAEVVVTPGAAPTVRLLAAAAAGQQLEREVSLAAGSGVLIHSDRAIYPGGATLQLEVLASESDGTVFVDAVQGGATLWTRALPLERGRATLRYDLPADVHGPVRLRAFRVRAGGVVERSDRVVLVRARDALSLTATLDRDTYRPGETAKLRVAVTTDGKAAPAAVSLAGVDEAVFSLSETRPGMERGFFEAGEVGGPAAPFSFDRVLALEGEARERAAGAALALRASPDDTVPLFGPESYEERAGVVAKARALWLRRLGGAALALPLALALLWLLVWVERAIRRTRGQTRPAIEEEQRLRVAALVRSAARAWCAGLLLPLGMTVAGGMAFRDVGAVAGLGIGTLVAWEWLRRVVDDVRREPELAAVSWFGDELARLLAGYGLLVVGVVGLGVNIANGWLVAAANVALGAAVLTAWALVAGTLAALGGALTHGRGGRRMLWPVLSRAVLVAAPVVVVIAATFVVSSWQMSSRSGVDAGGAVTETLTPDDVPAPGLQAPPEPSLATGPRVRSFFPETLVWEPQLITDAAGVVELDVPLADSITTWRLSLSAVSLAGRLGATETGLVVFQPFFVEPNLPVALTQNDEVTVPVAVFNYLDAPQSVTVGVDTGDWATLVGPATQTVTLASREVRQVRFRVKARRAGEHRFRVHASAGEVADAVERVVSVAPDGERVEHVASGTLKGRVALEAPIGGEAIPGSEDLFLKLYTGALSQVVEGMEGIFRMPSGCFEQTSSVTYPSLLVLDYLKRHGRLSPELEAKAMRFVQLGYQRLLSFEVPGGGFEWFGQAPAHPVLTAYGLMEFHDMKRVQAVDEAMLARTQAWLLSQQRPDGTWTVADAGIPEGATLGFAMQDLRTTAYVAWALAESGVVDPRLTRAFAVLAARVTEAQDGYTLALVANALVAGEHPQRAEALSRLASGAANAAQASFWKGGGEGMTYGRGAALDVETTALSAYALLRGEADVALAQRGLAWLSSERDPSGTWASTQATVAAMRALLTPAPAGPITSDVEVKVLADGEVVETVVITPETADVFRLVSLRGPARKGARAVTLEQRGEGSVAYQLVTRFHRPWPAGAPRGELELDVGYSTTSASVGEAIVAELTLRNRRKVTMQMPMLEAGLVPGAQLDVASLDALVASRVIERFELRGGRVVMYLRELPALGERKVKLRFVANLPAIAQPSPARAYLYYEPEVRVEARPVTVTVR